jgi:hypothetical protein
MVDAGMSQTACLWPEVEKGFGFVHRAAKILRNRPRQGGASVRRRYRALMRELKGEAPRAGKLKAALKHFVKVTESYWPGLFHCYDVPDLPRTHNALEQLFGSTRHHERRCTGRKAASPSLVLRGSVRIVAGLGTRLRCLGGEELTPISLPQWHTLRAGLEQRRQARTLRRRFRRNPVAYLKDLEALLQPTLPP